MTEASTIVERLAAVGTTVPESEWALIRAIVSQRAQEEARDDDGQGGVLQAAECTRGSRCAAAAVQHHQRRHPVRERPEGQR
ncbi:hypothetical protein ACFU8I_03560 [Streptomyces sp. NPDC057540]|uniref:hypothetical protein n=1 Tax=Streptomyces sp. NPDC057540 TaxID=3346160 RepID=UPI00369E4D2C